MGEVKVRSSKDHFIDEWASIFELSSDSPSGIVWKVPRGTNTKVGSPAGWLTELQYWKVEYKNKAIYVHRIVYFLSHGTLDKFKVVDHIDGKPWRNLPENLREITYDENTRNKRMLKINKSGVNGVHEIHEWVATWSEDGKSRSKSFPVRTFGDEAKRMATEYRDIQIQRLNSLDYNYTERHGL